MPSYQSISLLNGSHHGSRSRLSFSENNEDKDATEVSIVPEIVLPPLELKDVDDETLNSGAVGYVN